MHCLLVVVRYPTLLFFLGLLSMAVFHIPLFLNKKITFYKLMGCGKNGTFDLTPDLQQWSIMVFAKQQWLDPEDNRGIALLGFFIRGWLKLFSVSIRIIGLTPVQGHGSWDGTTFLHPSHTFSLQPTDRVAVLTRATIRLRSLIAFWKAVPIVAKKMDHAQGLQYSVGIGEIPFVKQATFSMWESMEAMQEFAYKKIEHKEVIKKTRKDNWYAEDMFLRFKVNWESVHLE
ncbi:MAG: spheroidene monooxygenase [Bacteroidetes bacterium]|nr:spheroidene monooxygenase [Bacteroidota bacterium]